MSSILSALFIMGMSPSSANSYDILAVYRPEPRFDCVVRLHARFSFACDPSGGSILERSPRAARSAPLPALAPRQLVRCRSLMSRAQRAGGEPPRRKGSAGSFNSWRGIHNMCIKVSSRSHLDVLERRQNCLKPVLRRELISYGRVVVSNGSPMEAEKTRHL